MPNFKHGQKNVLLKETIETINHLINLVLEEQYQINEAPGDPLPNDSSSATMDVVGGDEPPSDINLSSDSGMSPAFSSSSISSDMGSSASTISPDDTDSLGGDDAGMGGMDASGGMGDFSGGFGGGGGGGSGGDGFGDDSDSSSDSSGQENFSSSNPFNGVESAEDKIKIIMSTAEDIAKQTQNPQIVLKHVKGLIQNGFSNPDKAAVLISDLFNTENPVLQQVSRRLALFTNGI